MEDEELTRQIIGCAYQVHNTLGGGFMESVYQRAMAIELAKLGLSGLLEKKIPVHYESQLVGEFKADIVVENRVIIELKAVETLAKIYEVQLVNYLVATGIPIGLLINFSPERVDVKRKYRDHKPSH
ncbi:GxxExxY protein [Phycisphaeraceae bacterium D3-23]